MSGSDKSPENDAHSKTAKHQKRDENGRFIDEENPPEPFFKPASPLHITQNEKYSENSDPPLVSVSVTNPITYLKLWLRRLIKNEGIDFRFRIRPLTAILIAAVFALVFTGAGVSLAKFVLPSFLFPRANMKVTYQGKVEAMNNGYVLVAKDGRAYNLRRSGMFDLYGYTGKEVLVEGSLDQKNNILNLEYIELRPVITD